MNKVIIVEDETLQRHGLIQATPWQAHDCQVVGDAMNGADGLRLAMQLKPDIIITDIHMPDMDGLKMIERIKETVDCEFIILSGYGQFDYAKRAVSLGVQGYLLKPVDDDEFLDVLDKTVQIVAQKRQFHRLRDRYEQRCGNNIDSDYINMDTSNITDRYLSEAIDYICRYYAQDITCSSVADELKISSSYLAKLFKANTGYTFLEYLTQHRIRRAMQLLSDTSLRTYQIATRVGYQDTRYFSDIFKKIVGVTPTQYRNH